MDDKPVQFIRMEIACEEGWLGDPDEWPSLFFRNHVVRVRGLFGDYDLPGSWIERTSHSTVLVYMGVEDNGEDDDLRFSLLSAIPDLGRREGYQTRLEYEVDNEEDALWEMAFGLDDRKSLGGSQTPVADWAMRNGICPGQWFVVKLTPCYTTYEDYYGGGCETEFECDAEVLDKEHLSPQEHMRRWQEYLTGTELEDGLPRYGESMISRVLPALMLSWVCIPKGGTK